MKIKLFSNNVKLPIKSHLPDCGLDLFLPVDVQLNAFETKTVGLKFAVAIPEGFAGMLVPRSSIAEKGLIIQTSVIDPDYTGEIHLIITNCSNEVKLLKKDSRVCSLIVYSILNPYIEVVNELISTTRGKNGLGSTGEF